MNASRTNCFSIELARIRISNALTSAQHCFKLRSAAHARDRVIDTLMTAWQRGDELQGWQLDQVARDHIVAAGYGRAFVHQTGHSLAPGGKLHGWGVNLDNLQTHDTRTILPRTGFSIEPGIYLPAFGVRSEVNAFVDPITGPRITTPIQRDVILLA
jgi:Xaa-Pro aminopeptidase